MAEKEEEKQPIIIKKIKKGGGGHHGGAWKVAYADFVTAMMAFFLLLWLLNATTEEQKIGISNYFDPTPMKISEPQSGSGGVMGGTTVTPDGAKKADTESILAEPRPLTVPDQEGGEVEDAEDEALKREMEAREEERFKEAEEELKQAIESFPELKPFAKNLMIDRTPEGLRIQIVDQDGSSMFPSGSAFMYEKTTALLQKIAQVVQKMPNKISVRGHTDGAAYSAGDAGYNNWDLSADRANASRRVLSDAGVPAERLYNVVGKADTDHLFPEAPLDPRNRRISIILLKDSLVKAAEKKDIEADKATVPEKNSPDISQSQGDVAFP